MKARTILYSLYMVFSILISIAVAAFPASLLFLILFQNVDPALDQFGFLFPWLKAEFQTILGPVIPQFFLQHFWFFVFFIPIIFICYAIFLGVLLGMFLLSRRGIPFLKDGYYPMETEAWLLYEYYEIYYVIFPYFAWFFSVFLDTRPRHTLFGAKIGKNTVVGNGRLFNPERTIIGDNCFFGYDAILSGHVYESGRLYLREVRLGNNVTIGANAVVLAGADIGDNVIVAANSTVPKDKKVPPDTIWVAGKAIPRKKTLTMAELARLGIPAVPHAVGSEIIDDTQDEVVDDKTEQ
ncbi:MAG: acyltransferase [Candidatus Thorarchaeota archaeon]